MVNAFSFSDDGGKTFTAPRQSLHGDDRVVWIDPRDSRHLIKGDDGGVGMSYDRGLKWILRDLTAAEPVVSRGRGHAEAVLGLRRAAGQRVLGWAERDLLLVGRLERGLDAHLRRRWVRQRRGHDGQPDRLRELAVPRAACGSTWSRRSVWTSGRISRMASSRRGRTGPRGASPACPNPISAAPCRRRTGMRRSSSRRTTPGRSTRACANCGEVPTAA